MFDLTIQDFNGEPRMRDLDIAEALGFSRLRDVRQLVGRCYDALLAFGEVVCGTVPQTTSAGGRPGGEYWLNEHQTFYLCTQSKAARAVEVTQQIITVFVAWRHDRLALTQSEPADSLALTPDMMDIASLVREARLTHGRTAGQILWRKMGMPDLPVDEPALQQASAPVVGDDDILLFLHEAVLITGTRKDFTRSRDVYAAYTDFLGCDGVLGPRAFACRLQDLSKVYRCPSSKGTFWPAKSNHTGYRGLRLIPQ